MSELTPEQLAVSAIQHGTVIDHIASGQAFPILQLLALPGSNSKVTVGMNLPSLSMGRKDLIKIEGRVLTENEANEIVVFAPQATINVIEQFKVVKKINTHLPASIRYVFQCANAVCITQSEVNLHLFHILERGKQIMLICHYCEKEYERNEVMLRL